MGRKKKSHVRSAETTEELNRLIDNMTLFDDNLMSKVFDHNIEATECLLRVILERKDIRVVKVKGQYDMKNPYVKGREIVLDILAEDGDGTRFDLEVQRDRAGSDNRRVRFHSSMIDVRMLKSKQKFKKLKDAYVIFICQHDKFNQEKPVYHVGKSVLETGEQYEDGSHIIFVNGLYKGDDDLGKLAHDFNCKESKDMYFGALAEGVKHFKETEGGRANMSEAVEKFAERYAEKREEKTKVKMVKSLMKSTKWNLDKTLDALAIEGDERFVIANQLKK